MDSKEIAAEIYEDIKSENPSKVIELIRSVFVNEKTNKAKFTKTTLLNSVGQKLGKLLLNDDWNFEKLLELWKNGGRDEKLIVINAVGVIGKKDYKGTKEFVLRVVKDILDWEICDQLALKAVVHLLVQNRDEMFSIMESWKKSKSKWTRRLSVAVIPPYIRAKPDDFEICLNFLKGLMNESDRDVKKAIGWALREIAKKNPDAVFNFLLKQIKTTDKNTRQIIKDGMKKLPHEKQNLLLSLMKI